ncbi:MAG: adenylosuccinate lyase [Clostridia bacterium]|nr:adenylosuccinate lyase [Clostridia bacterium]
MIDRYMTEEMSKLWSEHGKFEAFTEIELLVCEAWNKFGKISDQDLKIIRDKADFQIERIVEIEKITNHDVIAYVENVAENIGPEGRFVHMGLTSSDVVDTSLTLRMARSLKIIREELENFISLLKEKINEHKNTVCLGRTHGIGAEPTTFGMKLGIFFEEAKRNLARIDQAYENIRVGKLSGAVGTYSNIDPFIEKYTLNALGLKTCEISTQVIQRDRIAQVMFVLSLIGAGIEKIALEVRHLQRTEVREAQEGFRKGQKGSSAMPHKKNPILSERLCGMSRILRANLSTAMENIALWHERDISHSSVERVTIPDTFHLTHYMLKKVRNLISGLIVNKERMMQNIENMNGLIFSQKILLAIVDKGIARDKAYVMVQRNAMKSWENNTSLLENMKNDEEIMELFSDKELESKFNLEDYLRNIDYVYEKMGV